MDIAFDLIFVPTSERFQVSGVRKASREILKPEQYYETPQVNVSIAMISAASMAGPGLNSEPQNNEYRTAEFRRLVSLRSIFS